MAAVALALALAPAVVIDVAPVTPSLAPLRTEVTFYDRITVKLRGASDPGHRRKQQKRPITATAGTRFAEFADRDTKMTSNEGDDT